MNQSAVGFFVGIDATPALASGGEPVIQYGGQQSSQNAAQNPSREDSLPIRFYFFSHLISATIAGFVSSLIVYLYLTRKNIKPCGEIIGQIIDSKNGAIILGDVSKIRDALPKIQGC
jgi:hypothetical protein